MLQFKDYKEQGKCPGLVVGLNALSWLAPQITVQWSTTYEVKIQDCQQQNGPKGEGTKSVSSF